MDWVQFDDVWESINGIGKQESSTQQVNEPRKFGEEADYTKRTGNRSTPIVEHVFSVPKRNGFFSLVRRPVRPHLPSFESLTRQRLFGEIVICLSDDRINKAQWLKCRGYVSPLHFLLYHRPPIEVVNTLILELKELGVTCPEAVTDSKGRNSVHIACSVSPSNSISVIARLMNGQTIISPCNPAAIADHCNMLPLHHACKANILKSDIEKRVLIIQFLTEYYPPGALAENHRGQTPSDLVRNHRNNPEILMILYKSIVDQRRYGNTSAFDSVTSTKNPTVQVYTRSEHRRVGGLGSFFNNYGASSTSLALTEDLDTPRTDDERMDNPIYPSPSDMMILEDEISELGSMYTSESISLCRNTESSLQEDALVTIEGSNPPQRLVTEGKVRSEALSPVEEDLTNDDFSQNASESASKLLTDPDPSIGIKDYESAISTNLDICEESAVAPESPEPIAENSSTAPSSLPVSTSKVDSVQPVLEKINARKTVKFLDAVEPREMEYQTNRKYELVDLDDSDNAPETEMTFTLLLDEPLIHQPTDPINSLPVKPAPSTLHLYFL